MRHLFITIPKFFFLIFQFKVKKKNINNNIQVCNKITATTGCPVRVFMFIFSWTYMCGVCVSTIFLQFYFIFISFLKCTLIPFQSSNLPMQGASHIERLSHKL